MNISKYKIYIPNSSRDVSRKSLKIANVLFAELANYGLELDAEAFSRLIRLKEKRALHFSKEILSQYTIGQVNPPLFPNWEERESFDSRDRGFQILGYCFQFCGNDFCSESFMNELKSKADFSKCKKIKQISDEEFTEYFEGLISTNLVQDKKTNQNLRKIFKTFSEEIRSLPRIKSAEVRIAALLELSKDQPILQSLNDLKCNSVDVLRFCAAKRDWNFVKLPAEAKFANLKWKERIDLLSFLEKRAGDNFDNISEDLSLNREMWKKFFGHIHFFHQEAFLNRFRNLFVAAFISLGNKMSAADHRISSNLNTLLKEGSIEEKDGGNLVYRSFASRFQSALDEKDIKQLLSLGAIKVNYLFRNLTSVSLLFQTKQEQKKFFAFCDEKLPSVDINVLFSLLSINADSEYRIIDMKGDTIVEPSNYGSLIAPLQERIRAHIKARYGFKGKVRVDSLLKKRIVPFLSKNAELERGSRFKIKENNNLFFYVHWIQDKQRTDLDLSFISFDEKWNQEVIYFRNQANTYLKHSGDLTSAPAPNGATEYGRVILNNIPKNVRYIVPVINVYAGSVFGENKEVRAGFFFSNNDDFSLERNLFNYKLTAPAEMNCPFVLDVKSGEIVTISFNQRKRRGFVASSYSTLLQKMISAANTTNYISIGDLAEMLSGDEDIVSAIFSEKASFGNEYNVNELHTLFSK